MTEKTYNFAIVGTGMIANFHAKAIEAMEKANLISCYARTKAKAEQFAAEYNCKAYDNLETLLQDNELDIVCICTASGAHLEPALLASKYKKHILCEKPLEVTIEKIDKIITSCEENNVKIASILPRRFNPASQLLKQAIKDGRFGTLSLVEASIKWYRDQAYYDSGAWRGTWALDGGGALMNQSIHTIDLLIDCVGEVESVCAFSDCLTHSNIEVEDTAVAILNFKNGAKGIIQGSTSCYSKDGHAAEVNICGDKGSAFLKDDKFTVWDFQEEDTNDENIRQTYGFGNAKGAGANDPKAIDFSWHQKNFQGFIDHLNGQESLYLDGYEGRRSVELIQAIYQSSKQDGKRIFLPLTNNN